MTTTRRAWCFTQFGGPEVEVLLDLPVPTPGEGQLLVRVRAAGVDPADWKVRAGLPSSVTTSAFPAVMGREVAGQVAALGPEVTGFGVGDRVLGAVAAGHGAYTELTLVDAASCAVVPDGVELAAAATLPVAGGTAYDAVEQLALGPDDVLLVVGAGGGVGSAAVQLAVRTGATVVGAASEAKRALVEGLGARWLAPDATAPVGVTAVFDLVGGEALAARAAQSPGARLVSVADKAQVTALGGRAVIRRRTTDVFTRVVALVASGDLDPLVSARFPLERAGEAVALVQSGHATGKVVIEVA